MEHSVTRKFITIVLTLTTLSMSAQQIVPSPASQPHAGSNWQHVQALPVGASIQVKASKSHASCKLKSVVRVKTIVMNLRVTECSIRPIGPESQLRGLMF